MGRLIQIVALFSLCYAGVVPAQEQGVGAGAKLIAIEAMIAAASYAAAERPKEVGIGTGLLIPMAAYMDKRSSPVTAWTGVIVAEAIAYYNYQADGDEDISRDDIIKKNFIGWNIFALTVGLSDFFFPVQDEQTRARGPQLSFRHNPVTDQHSLQISYRF